MTRKIMDDFPPTPDGNQEPKSRFDSRRVINTVQKVAEDPASHLCKLQHFLDVFQLSFIFTLLALNCYLYFHKHLGLSINF